MKILLSITTDEGGAKFGIERWVGLLRDVVDFYFLSVEGHQRIGLHPDTLKHHQFANEWAIYQGIKICNNIEELPTDTIVLESNNMALWANPKTLERLKRFARRATHNNVFWIDDVLPPAASRFIGNYLCNFKTEDILKNLKYFYAFTNIQEVLPYRDYDFMASCGKFSDHRDVDFLTSFRPNSYKVSPKLMTELKEIIASAGLSYQANPMKYPNHGEYLVWIKSNVRGYLHFQDQWIETFGSALYEGIKLCDFVIYRPEPYCDKMIARLPPVDQAKVIRVNDEKELAITLLKKDFLRFPKTSAIAKDIYTDKNYVRSQLLAVLGNLHEGR